MKINPHDPAYPLARGLDRRANGLPIRLELAARLLAAMVVDNSPFDGSSSPEGQAKAGSRLALTYADALIAAYNDGQE